MRGGQNGAIAEVSKHYWLSVCSDKGKGSHCQRDRAADDCDHRSDQKPPGCVGKSERHKYSLRPAIRLLEKHCPRVMETALEMACELRDYYG
jgi:hypothetical protein